jgi:N-formylglutamate deformylase
MSVLILHIPHSSTNIPLKDGYVVGEDILNSELLKLTDWYTNDLFHSASAMTVKADFSRIFCDPERFADDSQEVMSQYGMGALYIKTDLGDQLRVISPELREKILNEYYWPHHKRLSKAVDSQLKEFSKAIIVDCHSYPNIPFLRDLNKTPNRPDFNIGSDPFHTPKELVELSVGFFKQRGHSFGIDWPYKGSIVPLEYYQKDARVKSVMLEVNRKLYLEENSNKKSQNYHYVKNIVQDYIEKIKSVL